ncbi:MAG: hypothetical protein WKF81_13755, partial [Thermomicrobiales bacterium]
LLLDLNDTSLRSLPNVRRGVANAVLDSTEEFAVAVTASLADRALADGRKVGLVVNRSMPVRLLPDSSQRQWSRIFETLAVATSFGHRPLDEAISAESSRLSRMTSLIVITATRDAGWVKAVRGLTERRIPVCVVLIDDAWEGDGDDSLTILEQSLVSARSKVIRYATSDRDVGPQSGSERRTNI